MSNDMDLSEHSLRGGANTDLPRLEARQQVPLAQSDIRICGFGKSLCALAQCYPKLSYLIHFKLLSRGGECIQPRDCCTAHVLCSVSTGCV